MQLIVVAVGSRMPAWVDAAFDDYASRMPPELRVILREIRPEPRTSGKTVEVMMAAEAERIRNVLPKRGALIALDERGAEVGSAALADQLASWRADGDDVAFVVGGPDGLDARLRAEARTTMRLSTMTLPHGLARVVLAEQLYRAWSITQNHPYHRA
jgi:23S rRNA (pseudouridine1915-N3)-methyltransferase